MTENLEATLIGKIGDARHALGVATAAVETNGRELASTQHEIAELQKLVPTVTRLDGVRQMQADTMARKSGLA